MYTDEIASFEYIYIMGDEILVFFSNFRLLTTCSSKIRIAPIYSTTSLYQIRFYLMVEEA